MTSEDSDIPFFDLVSEMRAMRRLKPDPISDALLRKVLDAGVKALVPGKVADGRDREQAGHESDESPPA